MLMLLFSLCSNVFFSSFNVFWCNDKQHRIFHSNNNLKKMLMINPLIKEINGLVIGIHLKSAKNMVDVHL